MYICMCSAIAFATAPPFCCWTPLGWVFQASSKGWGASKHGHCSAGIVSFRHLPRRDNSKSNMVA